MTEVKINTQRSPTYREAYANSVRVQVSVWDFFLSFGVMHQDTPEAATIIEEQAIYLSPQQAKALWQLLGQNLAQYEQTFGPLNLETKDEERQAIH